MTPRQFFATMSAREIKLDFSNTLQDSTFLLFEFPQEVVDGLEEGTEYVIVVPRIGRS